MTQWHPLLIHLLRPMIEEFYEVITRQEVGDSPRHSDLVFLKRTNKTANFTGLWRFLTAWNILEYKGPSVSARLAHIASLVELGLGIERRLNELGRKEKRRTVPAEEVSFWYFADNIGRRFREQAARWLVNLERRSEGVWSSTILGRPLFLVAIKDLPVELDSAAFHILHGEPAGKGLAVLRLTAEQPDLWQFYSQVFGNLHPDRLQEIEAMARNSKKGPQWRMKEVADYIGWQRTLEELGGKKKVIEQIGEKEIIQQIGEKEIIQQIGEKEIIQQIGTDNVIDEVFGFMDEAERAALKRRLHEAEKSKKKK